MAVITRRTKKTTKKISRPRTSQADVQVPATPSPRTLAPNVIENIQINLSSNENHVRRLIEQELAKISERRPSDRQRDPHAQKSQAEAPSSDKSISRLIQRMLAEVRDKRDDSDSQNSYRVHKSWRRRHRRRHYLFFDFSTNSENKTRPKISFLHLEKGTHDQALNELTFAFLTVVMKRVTHPIESRRTLPRALLSPGDRYICKRGRSH